jgi:hypothetical protein
MMAELTVIRKCGVEPLMSKRIFLNAQGELQSDGSQCLMVQGEAERVAVPTAGKLAEVISRCPSDSAIALGALSCRFPAGNAATDRI